MVFGDFKLTRDPSDRNNDNFDAAAAQSFNAAVDTAQLQKLPLSDRQFTWSNRREVPTLVRLDRAFINAAWSSLLSNSILSSLPRLVSDHVPIVVAASSQVPASSVFPYEKT